MKPLFLALAVALSFASVGTWLTIPESRETGTVIYWATDRNPARVEQIVGFHEWLIGQGHTLDAGEPSYALHSDVSSPATVSGNRGKRELQGVSGVAAEILDMWKGADVRRYARMGILVDLTRPMTAFGFTEDHGFTPRQLASPAAEILGFDLNNTFPSIAFELVDADGVQRAFPCNVTGQVYVLNRAAFRRVGLEPPSFVWTWDEFETLGLEYVRRANDGTNRLPRFLTGRLDIPSFARSAGASVFNETLTASALDRGPWALAMHKMLEWEAASITASRADEISVGSGLEYRSGESLLQRGVFAMINGGRYTLVKLRRFGMTDIGAALPPHAIMPGSAVGTRCAGVYAGASPEQQRGALLFLAYLADEPYNMQIVRDADGLPPNPLYCHSEGYLEPALYPHEHGLHKLFFEAANRYGYPSEYSPFLLQAVVDRVTLNMVERVRSGLMTPEAAALDAKERLDREIRRTVDESPLLQRRFAEALERQQRIDAIRDAGETVPLDLIDNALLHHFESYMRGLKPEIGPPPADRSVSTPTRVPPARPT